MSRFFVIITVLLSLFIEDVRAQRDSRWLYSFNLDVSYDDNLFCLSPLDIDIYRRGENPARFPYRSADDVDLTLAGTLRWRPSSIWAFQWGIKLHQMVVNQEKSYGLFNFQFERRFMFSNVSLFYTWMPNYFIRYYRDLSSSGEHYTACRFGEHLFEIRFVQKFGWISVAPVYKFEIDDYIPPFDYYDTRAHRFGGRLNLDLEKNFLLRGNYEFKLAQARGPIPDISYYQHWVKLNLATRPRIFNRFGVTAGYSWKYRSYTVDDTARDLAHTGRVDQTNTIVMGCNYHLQQVTLVFDYQLEWREVSSPYQEKIEDIKNYRANRFSLGVRLPFVRVRNSARMEEETGD